VEEGLKLCLKALKKVLGEKFVVERIDAACIKTDEKKFTKFTKDKIEKVAAGTKDVKSKKK